MADDSMLSTPTSNAHDDTFDMDEESILQHETHIPVTTVDIPSSFPQHPITAASQPTTIAANTSAHLNASHPSELSPPRSQNATPANLPPTHSNGSAGFPPSSNANMSLNVHRDDQVIDQDDDDDEGVDMGEDDFVDTPGVIMENGNVGRRVGQDNSKRGRGVEKDDKPGAGWRNKKAQEEMARAWEFVVDRDWSVKQYGDPLAHKV